MGDILDTPTKHQQRTHLDHDPPRAPATKAIGSQCTRRFVNHARCPWHITASCRHAANRHKINLTMPTGPTTLALPPFTGATRRLILLNLAAFFGLALLSLVLPTQFLRHPFRAPPVAPVAPLPRRALAAPHLRLPPPRHPQYRLRPPYPLVLRLAL